MLAKQFIRASLRAVKASSSPSTALQVTRLSVPSVLRSARSTQHAATPIRWISSSPSRFEEPAQATSPSSDNQAYSTADLPAVYLSNLSFSVTEESLTEFLREHTPVKKVDVVRNNEGVNRGFGFAKYATQAEAEAAVGVINGLNFLGRSIVAALSQRRPVISDASNQLFMSGFPTQGEADEGALRSELQERLGVQPQSIRFHKFPGGFLKGTGHLEFDSVETLERVLVKLQELGPDQPIAVKGHPLTLVKARPLLQPRSRGRGDFGHMRGRGPPGGPGYGAPYAGAYGGYQAGPADGYPSQMGGYPGPVSGGGYSNQGYGDAPYPPPPGSPGSDGYGGYGGPQGQGGRGDGNPPY